MKIKRKSKKIKGENKKKVERENGCKKVDYIIMKNERKLREIHRKRDVGKQRDKVQSKSEVRIREECEGRKQSDKVEKDSTNTQIVRKCKHSKQLN